MNDLFRRFAAGTSCVLTSCVLGTPWAFLLAIAFVAIWAATGAYFEYSEAWQLVINTSTTIGTFLMVFLLQSTQNRDTNVSDLADEELDRLEAELRTLGRRAGVGALPAMSGGPTGGQHARVQPVDTV